MQWGRGDMGSRGGGDSGDVGIWDRGDIGVWGWGQWGQWDIGGLWSTSKYLREIRVFFFFQVGNCSIFLKSKKPCPHSRFLGADSEKRNKNKIM